MKIYYSDEDQTVEFAAQELKKYLSKISKKKIIIEERKSPDFNNINQEIWLTILSNVLENNSSQKYDSELDDKIKIDIKKDQGGIISGNNSRSVLLAVYRYLSAIGFDWIRPGTDGEIIPNKNNLLAQDIKFEEEPSYRHRGICIEGAVSCEHVRDIIEWAPKVGFNSYFIQFREAYTFFERWYQHQNNPQMKEEECTLEKVRAYVDDIINEIKKRDMLYHAVGHGWTCEPFDIQGLGWDKEQFDIQEEKKQYFAKVDGKRKLWEGVPLNTNLCYSNPEVRQIIIEDIVEYIEDNQEINFLQFWLADGSNNHCECINCTQKRPSDFYVMMLNELDKVLNNKGLDTKIVFLVYADTLWPPVTEKIKNKERNFLMFAPITRTYRNHYSSEDSLPEIPEFKRNNLEYSKQVETNVAFLKEWQKDFEGDSLVFDYHLLWDQYFDPGHMNISNILIKDIKNLKNIGLNGFMSCQTQRTFFPTGFAMVAMGNMLWDDSLKIDKIKESYFKTAFGENGQKCKSYLNKVSRLFPFMGENSKEFNKTNVLPLNKLQSIIEDFRPVIEKNCAKEDLKKAQIRSWEYLEHHADITYKLAQAFEEKSLDNSKKAQEKWEDVVQMIQNREEKIHQVFDVYLFIKTVSKFFVKEKTMIDF